ncbi:MAG TPA: DUF1800 domain-containing protein [Candidatus Angelobacter sp.]|nr:DUF1800 domain-containing protein [Candidatus Angelobacter sp.]
MAVARKQLILLGLILLACTVILAAGDKKSKHKTSDATTTAASMDDDKRIIHALNRFTFGLRPGEVERVRAMGLDQWFDEQLHPDRINDSAVEARLDQFRTLKMSTRDMVQNFPPDQVLKQVENGRMSMPSDPGKRAIYESRIAAYQQRQENKQNKGALANSPTNDAASNSNPAAATGPKDTPAQMKLDPSDPPTTQPPMTADQQQRKQREDAMYADIEKTAPAGAKDAGPAKSSDSGSMPPTQQQGRQQERREDAMYADIEGPNLLQMSPDERYKAIIKMSPYERLDLARRYRGEKGMQLLEGMTPQQRETIEAIVQPQAVVGGELSEAKVLRAIYSDRQLEEVMADFWFNHFNVFIGKGPDRYMLNAYERDVIRPHALGKFKDLLAATAKSPAMLFYLDNWQSVGPHSELALYGNQRRPARRGRFMQFPRPQQANKNRPSGLNENYAREIMELHTLGVDGGYTQRDVTELAKVLTGWSIEQPQLGGSFRYNDRAHEPGAKYILGRKIGEHGEKEGEEMLDILAHHPSTAKFISRKLAMRFVSDNPPQSLVNRMAETFEKKDGDIREVLRTMFRSPEFWAADAYRAKMKTPFEFVVSAVRASGADVQNAMPLVQTLNRMGMQLYGMQPPTGYSMKAEAWVNSSALLNRMNFALTLGSGHLQGATVDPKALIQGPAPVDAEAALAALEQGILAGDVSQQTHSVIEKQLNDPKISRRKLDDPAQQPNYGAIAGLIMGSPEFQRR